MALFPCLSQNIYLADDDEDDRLFFEQALREVCRDSKLTALEDGEQLMNKLVSSFSVPDILFLDINMPGKGGFECLRELRSMQHLREVPVVMCTTSDAVHSVISAYEFGATNFMAKPSDFAQLKRTLQTILNIDWSLRSKDLSRGEFVISVA